MTNNIKIGSVLGVAITLAVIIGLVVGVSISPDAANPRSGGVSFEDEVIKGDVTLEKTLTVDGASTLTGDVTASGAFAPSALTFPVTTVTATTTLTSANFGEVVFFDNASGTLVTLPAATAGAQITFVVGAVFADVNAIVDSAEGDNIEGSLIVAGAVVDCDAEDQINFVADGENIGDYVQLTSDGTSWHITGSNALTSAKLTCTDPS